MSREIHCLPSICGGSWTAKGQQLWRCPVTWSPMMIVCRGEMNHQSPATGGISNLPIERKHQQQTCFILWNMWTTGHCVATAAHNLHQCCSVRAPGLRWFVQPVPLHLSFQGALFLAILEVAGKYTHYISVYTVCKMLVAMNTYLYIQNIHVSFPLIFNTCQKPWQDLQWFN